MDVNRRPTAVTYKAFVLVLWLPTALGLVPLPGSLDASPGLYGQICAWTVVCGAAVSLIGLLWRGEALTGLRIEQVGLIGIAGGCLLYFIALVGVPKPLEALPAMGFVGAFTAGAVVQFVLIWRFTKQRIVTT